jgi:CRP-like cAMP-binding protein
MKRLEENLVDQKVKLEIMELRVQRASSTATVGASSRVLRAGEIFAPQQEPEVSSAPKSPSGLESVGVSKADVGKHPGGTEREALRLVLEGRGKTTGKDIQQKIGRTREHTARMMNSLFQDGLVDRDVTVRPFAYSITQKGSDLLNS